ncbi:hypothetical protein [Brevundimonas sp.]|uniref:hypothetical protein n=1 Tax=Brevundimonas sp. TaxID=1871086 RepID=UPI00289F92DF|nr:hypothetical protein [Brevundimonas sp.]
MMIELAAAAMLLANMDPEGVVATAPRGDQSVPTASAAALAASTTDASPSTTVQSAAPHGLSTDEQIARWIGERTAETASKAPADPWAESEPRKMHGEFSVGMGTGGYQDYAAAVSLPIGENGTLNLSVSQTKNGPWGYGYGSPWGYGGPYGGYARPFGVMEPPGFEGTYFRGRPYAPLRLRPSTDQGTTKSAGVSLEIGR